MGDRDQNVNLLKGLADFIVEGHRCGSAEERLDDEIRAAGIDPQAYLSRFSALVDGEVLKRRQAIHAERLNAGGQIAATIKKVKAKLSRLTPEDEKTWAAKLEPRLAGAYFRNFTSASPADKASMIEDLELLEKLNEITGDGK